MILNNNNNYHTPVMLDEVVWLMNIKPGGIYVDCTLGSGGHTLGFLEFLGSKIQIIGIDKDKEAISTAKQKLRCFGDAVTYVQGSFSKLQDIVENLNIMQVDGVLFDLGVSSYQLDKPERGFSYMEDGPLDMRMNQDTGKSAKDLINSLSANELAYIFKTYGEERWAVRISKFIEKWRKESPITSTTQLVNLIKAAIPSRARRTGPHPARRTFQALRIAVNKELNELELGLTQANEILSPGGRLVAISYHSLEDRIVKTMFRQKSKDKNYNSLRVLTKRPIVPCKEEIMFNPRSRSAKLRAAEKF